MIVDTQVHEQPDSSLTVALEQMQPKVLANSNVAVVDDVAVEQGRISC